jgi:hypothetical protein
MQQVKGFTQLLFVGEPMDVRGIIPKAQATGIDDRIARYDQGRTEGFHNRASNVPFTFLFEK